MHFIKKSGSLSISPVFIFTGIIAYSPSPVSAQALEEIVVTAQRRVQSLQDVPISIETVTGASLREQGDTDLKQLASHLPGLVLGENDIEESVLTIRGAGTQGKNLTIEQAAPVFVDGLHFGRASSTKSAFLDIDRIEVLRGPQPIFFGQNATAGAISINSRRPGPEWEGFVDGEIGRWNTQQIEFGVGGPINDSFGIRVAGKYDKTDGFMRDWFSEERYPNQSSKVGRVILQWKPTEQLSATVKFDYADQTFGDQPDAVFRNIHWENADLRFPQTILITGLEESNREPITSEIGDIGRLGVRAGPVYILGPERITVSNTAANDRVLDITGANASNMDVGPGFMGFDGPEEFNRGEFTGKAESTPWHTYLELDYQLPNDIELVSLTGYSRQEFMTIRGAHGVFSTSTRHRAEDFKQWSQELRLVSPTGGFIEWMAGAYWQKNDLFTQSNDWRANGREQMRGNRTMEDARWLSAFAALTFNFFDNKASIDIGGRYTDIKKEGEGFNVVAQWIVENPVTGVPEILPRGTMPVSYHHARIVGRTQYEWNGESVSGEINENDFNPQVVLRYRPNDDVSLYAKYAEAFKGGGFDSGVTHLPTLDEDFVFKPEYTNIYETGARMTFLDGRANAGLTLFWSNYRDLQVAAIDRNVEPNRNRTTNAAHQRSRGVEMNGSMAVTDQFRVNMSLAYLDAEMVEFPGAVCTVLETDTGLCGADDTIDRSGQPARNAPEWQGQVELDYWMPFMTRYKLRFNTNLSGSDGYITDLGWSTVTMMDTEFDASAFVQLSDADDTWDISIWTRNLLAPKPTYHPENHPQGNNPTGISGASMKSSNFTSYGIKAGYNF